MRNQSLRSLKPNLTAIDHKHLAPTKKLSQTIKHYESEEKFDILVKIGEANSMLKDLDDPSYFEISSLFGKRIQISFVEPENTQTLTEIDFQRVFKQIERRLNMHKNKNFWNIDMRKQKQKKCNFKGTVLLVLEEKDEVTKQKINQRIKQRDKQLKSLLLETAHLKMLLKQQYELLQRKGINSK